MQAERLTRVRDKIKSLAICQENLTEARQQLLVKREDVIENTRRVRKQRIRTGDAEVSFMKILRATLNELGIAIPSGLSTAYAAVEREDSKLRIWEEQLLETEQDLGAEEWTFLELENNFYQSELCEVLSEDGEDIELPLLSEFECHLPSTSSITPSKPVEYQAKLSRHDELQDKLDALRRQEVIRMETFTQPDEEIIRSCGTEYNHLLLSNGSSALLDQISHSEVKIQALRIEMSDSAYSFKWRMRPFSEADLEPASHAFMSQSLDAHSDGDVEYANEDKYPQIDVQDWSLDCLKKSAMEKLQYLNILRARLGDEHKSSLDAEHWRTQATKFWSDNIGVLNIHNTNLWTSTPPVYKKPEDSTMLLKGCPETYVQPQEKKPILVDKDEGQHLLRGVDNGPNLYTRNEGLTDTTPRFQIDVTAIDELQDTEKARMSLLDKHDHASASQNNHAFDQSGQLDGILDQTNMCGQSLLTVNYLVEGVNSARRFDSAQNSDTSETILVDRR